MRRRKLARPFRNLTFEQKRERLVVQYEAGFTWHFRLDGSMWIRSKMTGQVFEVGRVD